MAPRERKFDLSIPKHIDQAKIPRGVYWDRTGRGRWFVFENVDGKKKRKTVAGPAAKLSDLHSLVEDTPDHGTVEWLCGEYHASAKFKKLAKTTQADYEYSRDVMMNFPTQLGIPFGKLRANSIRNIHLQRMIDKLDEQGTPTKANKVLRYSRLLFRWGLNRGKGLQQNPAQGLEAAKERKQQRYPQDLAYMAMLEFAQKGAALKGRSKGSCPAYLPLIMEIGFLCRLRGIETLTLVEAQGEKEGLRTNRRKGSKDNVVKWTPRLRSAWDAALKLRREMRGSAPELIRPEDRFVFLTEGGEPLTKSGLDTAWQRLATRALEEGVIALEQRFSLHDLKRKGITDTPGTSADKQDAAGLSSAMMKTYDKSLPVVDPSA